MRITIIFDNEVWKQGLKATWGFACLVEAHKKKILFDIGSNGTILLENMKKIDINPLTIDLIFISHAYSDHTGGLKDILRIRQVVVYVPDSYLSHIKGMKLIKVKDTLKIIETFFPQVNLEVLNNLS